ncbi:uncharacterized protein LOC110379599 [Helicoverpa armigera]|uniref:uncharacterized protein LOC110379599 n=1 Tax=Helicoverpa armigera TaxID=29058 RepID=UPI00308383CC
MAVFDFLNPLANVTPRFTEEQLEQMVQWFDENSKPLLIINNAEEPTNVVTIEQLISFLELKKFHRRAFKYPSYLEIMTEAEKLNAGVIRMLTKDQFIYILNVWVQEADIKHELQLAFKVFDTENREYLELDEIKEIVTVYGDHPFDEREALEIMRDANVRGDGQVFYADFIESLFSLAPELYKMKTDYLYENADEDPSVPPEPVVEEPPPHPHHRHPLHLLLRRLHQQQRGVKKRSNVYRTKCVVKVHILIVQNCLLLKYIFLIMI